ncbi:hypothetical protein IQ260_02745 [Leptolyngbya cf. ectocarpi LEGE 11479]|uniref:MFS transporter n=1 Tax=Leptolyngbya cf. ectocarpi LEGE 11479 TaxID=1828722 RepID=A0A928X1B3_LEPEC|nr:hypothetical protein [Leptolyngbya ectocarpi]MBE9065566.1 hypothetical protein [Leptolyngbya cf. ectocarpi LEGE 11479]
MNLTISPGHRARIGAVVGVFVPVLMLMGYCGTLLLRTRWGIFFDAVISVLISAIAVALLSGTIALIIVFLTKLPRLFSSYLASAWLALLLLLNDSPVANLPLATAIVLALALLGGAIAMVTSPNFITIRLSQKILLGVVLSTTAATSLGCFIWLIAPGTAQELLPMDMGYHPVLQALEAPNPAKLGSYKVKTLTYGSGEDWRTEFGHGAQLRTQPVDGSAFLNSPQGWIGNLTGLHLFDGWFQLVRQRYWGFDRSNLPLNGRVWYPEGEGKFPLVLVVHGNHLMREYSDPGYAYLGELLASRGYIFISIDENFLNSDWSNDYKKENEARGWLMLEHLNVWRSWNTEIGNPFYQKVDLDRISLMGHSRGGEAINFAVAFNHLQYYPNDANVKFDYGFNIRSIVAIAPVDFQSFYQSAPLEDINYLVLQGTHDADVFRFLGDRQYKRVKFTKKNYRFKSSIYIYRANHGQFNTVWGNRDRILPYGYSLNTKPLLTGEEQRQIAKVYISAFLDTTLKDEEVYLPIFHDYRLAADWLPKTHYISRFEDSRTHIVSDFDEDIDLTTTSINGGSQVGENLRVWTEKDLGFRISNTKRQNQAVYLGWEYNEADRDWIRTDSSSPSIGAMRDIQPASYTITLPSNFRTQWPINSSSSLTFSLADVNKKSALFYGSDAADVESATILDSKKDKQTYKSIETKGIETDESENRPEEIEKRTKIPIDFTIEVEDLNEQTAALPLSKIASLLPPLKAKFTRYRPWEKRYGFSSESVLQTIEIPMFDFLEVNGQFNPSQIKAIRFRFDRVSVGMIILDEVGIRLTQSTMLPT